MMKRTRRRRRRRMTTMIPTSHSMHLLIVFLQPLPFIYRSEPPHDQPLGQILPLLYYPPQCHPLVYPTNLHHGMFWKRSNFIPLKYWKVTRPWSRMCLLINPTTPPFAPPRTHPFTHPFDHQQIHLFLCHHSCHLIYHVRPRMHNLRTLSALIPTHCYLRAITILFPPPIQPLPPA